MKVEELLKIEKQYKDSHKSVHLVPNQIGESVPDNFDEDIRFLNDGYIAKHYNPNGKTTSNLKKQGFNDFEIFCEFCNSLKNLDIKKICKNTILYSYKNTYYLVIKNINNNYEKSNMFFSKISEFAKLSPFSNNFENKLIEHGKTIIKKDAIEIGIKYFNIA